MPVLAKRCVNPLAGDALPPVRNFRAAIEYDENNRVYVFVGARYKHKTNPEAII